MYQTGVEISGLLWKLFPHEAYGPPTILEPSVITTDDCYDMYNRRAFIYRGQTIKIELNTIVSIPMIVHGSVTNDENNTYWTGAKFAIDGEQHSNMLAFETVRLSYG